MVCRRNGAPNTRSLASGICRVWICRASTGFIPSRKRSRQSASVGTRFFRFPARYTGPRSPEETSNSRKRFGPFTAPQETFSLEIIGNATVAEISALHGSCS
jgi:hypothetical protein